MRETNEKFLSLIIGAALILIISAIGIVIILEESKEIIPQYTTSYETIDITVAQEIMASTTNLTVIDCREGCGRCQFNKGHLPGAILSDNPLDFYNSTDDILVYSVDGSVGADFCQQLVNHTYGAIYNLEGGYNAWTNETQD